VVEWLCWNIRFINSQMFVFFRVLFVASVNVDVFEKDEIFWYSVCRSYKPSSSTLQLQAASNLTVAVLSATTVKSPSQSELYAYWNRFVCNLHPSLNSCTLLVSTDSTVLAHRSQQKYSYPVPKNDIPLSIFCHLNESGRPISISIMTRLVTARAGNRA
jgi:hypothetical protein